MAQMRKTEVVSHGAPGGAGPNARMKATGPVKTGANVRPGSKTAPTVTKQAVSSTTTPPPVGGYNLANTLTPDQLMASYDRQASNAAKWKESVLSDENALAQNQAAIAELNHSRALQAQRATDNLISRGLLQSGTAAGQLGDIELAASKQRDYLNQALLQTQQRNLAIQQNIIADEDELTRQNQRQAAMNIADGTVTGPSPLGGQPQAGAPSQPAKPAKPAKPAAPAPYSGAPTVTKQAAQKTTTTPAARPMGNTITGYRPGGSRGNLGGINGPRITSPSPSPRR